MSRFTKKQRKVLKELSISVYTWGKEDYVDGYELGLALGYSENGTRLVRMLRSFESGYGAFVNHFTADDIASSTVRVDGRKVSHNAAPLCLLSVEGLGKFLETRTTRNDALYDKWHGVKTSTTTQEEEEFVHAGVSNDVQDEKRDEAPLKGSMIPLDPDTAIGFVQVQNGFSKWPPQVQADFILSLKKMDNERTNDAIKAIDEFVGFADKAFSPGELFGIMRLRTEMATGINMRHLVPAHLIDTGWKTPTEIAKDVCKKIGLHVNQSNTKSVLHFLDFKKYQGTEHSYRYITKAENVNDSVVLVQAYYYSPFVQNEVAETFKSSGNVEKVQANSDKRAGKKATNFTNLYAQIPLDLSANGVPASIVTPNSEHEAPVL